MQNSNVNMYSFHGHFLFKVFVSFLHVVMCKMLAFCLVNRYNVWNVNLFCCPWYECECIWPVTSLTHSQLELNDRIDCNLLSFIYVYFQ